MTKTRRGAIVALIGSDGSGKTSVIELLSESPKLNQKFKSLRTVYLGYNNFWIPGLTWANERYRKKKSSYVGAVVKGIALVDIKLRSIRVRWLRLRGFAVLCDRFYYDHLIGDPIATFSNSRVLKKIFEPFIRWSPLTPDFAFHLKVSPEEAHRRKPEFSLDKFREIAESYSQISSEHENITVIDADQPLKNVVADIENKMLQPEAK